MWSKASSVLMAILLSVPWAAGQSTFGGIVGVVKDPSQGALAGAQLTLTSLDDGSQRNASTDGNGGFEFANLKAGHYELVLHADGFADYKVSSMQLDARQTLRLDVSLKLANSSQSTGQEVASSVVTRRMAMSRPRPASTQTTMRSSASGRPRKIASDRCFLM